MENPTVIVDSIRKDFLTKFNKKLHELFDEAHAEYNSKYQHEIEVDFGDCKDEDWHYWHSARAS